MTEKVIPGGTVGTLFNDETVDDSDKTLTIDSGHVLDVSNILVELTTTATVGNRQLELNILDGADVVFRAVAGAVQAASLTRYYNFAAGSPNESAFVSDTIFGTLPVGLRLSSSHSIRVFDSAAIDAAADDMSVRVLGTDVH